MTVRASWLAPLAFPALLVGAQPAQSARHCVERSYPKSLPTPAQLIDTGRAMRQARQLSAGRKGSLLMSIQFDTLGSRTRARVIGGDLDSAVAHTLSDAVTGSLKRQPKRASAWGARLRVSLGAAPTLRVERSEWCAPSATTRRAAAPFEDVEIYDPTRDSPDARVAAFLTLVDAAGSPIETNLYRSSGDAALDSRLTAAASTFHYLPALDDLVPVAAEDTLRLTARRKHP